MAKRIVIVGGVAGGMSAAARARRVNESASITVLEKGPYISFANCGLPYHIAGRIASEEKLLVTTAERVRSRFNIDVRPRHEALRIDRGRRVVEGINHATGESFELAYDKLIQAPGADPIIPPIGNIRAANVLTLRNMEDTQAVKRYLETANPKSAVVIGAGFIGLEMAEALKDRQLKVTVVEKAPHALPVLDADMAPWIHKELASRNVDLVTGDGLAELQGDAKKVTAVKTESGKVIEADLVLLSIGVRPSAGLAKAAGLAVGASGAIEVDEVQRTNDPDIYAVGDATEVVHGVTGRRMRIPLAGPANRQGRTAGEHAATGNAKPAGSVLGTAIVQVFGLSIGVTGLTEAAARAAGYDVDFAMIHAGHHAGYYPGAVPLHVKLVYEKASGKVLGAQVAGGPGVDKRLDVVATLIHFGGTIDDLARLDLAYAPQFGSAKDPLHMAAFVAQNQKEALTPSMAVSDLNGELRLDVRTPQEFAQGTLEGAINIPVEERRDRLGELDPEREIAVFCQVGVRGHIATRILRQHGFEKVRNVRGGYTSAAVERQ